MSMTDIAARHKGHRTWGFSQSDFSVWRFYRTMGICAGLSAEWIKHHAQGGSLANVLGGGGVGPLNVGKLKEIARLHGAISDNGDVQRTQLGLFLQMNDILPLHSSRTITVTTFRGDRQQTQTRPLADGNGGNCPNIENDIVAALRKLNGGCYARINFSGTAFGKGAGHAIAAWIGGRGEDGMLFDPNYGEFWFEKRDDLMRFFPEFYRKAYRSFPIYFATDWETLPCAPKVRSRR